jgi:hypothetical protein
MQNTALHSTNVRSIQHAWWPFMQSVAGALQIAHAHSFKSKYLLCYRHLLTDIDRQGLRRRAQTFKSM